ncbi:MAG: SpoIID/LytB domain-containing protein [Clostridia bacterium]
MKRVTAVVIAIIMILSIGVSTEASDYKETLRIGLNYGESALSNATFYSQSDINVYDGVYYSYITTIPAYTNVNITALNGLVTSDYFSGSNVIRLESDSVMKYNNKGYKGVFEIRNQNNLLTVINIVNTEDYVASVLGKEMSASWPIEALKAQAVCARNYAFTIRNKHTGNGFDLCATIDCQVYGGVESEAESTRKAAEETKGVTVLYNGRIVPLYYFSCDGGYTEDSENVWVSSEGYLRGKQDIYESPQYATKYNWSKSYTKTEIEQILASKGINIGNLLDITIDEVSANQSVMKMTFVGTLGNKTITKSQARTTLSLNSQTYTIEKSSNSLFQQNSVAESYYVLSSSGVSFVERPESYLTSTGIKFFSYPPILTNTEGYDQYTFNGHGWGHRVGMSQWGAYSMAKMGYTYKDILNFYFTDITIN